MIRKVLLGALSLAVLAVALVYVVGNGWLGTPEQAGEISPLARPAVQTAARSQALAVAARGIDAHAPKQILFGDFHVHTTFSSDAFGISLPITGSDGVHPPADACDFARHCSALDFWSINDHAESITPRMWTETIDLIQQCAAVGQDPHQPDTVPFVGWEWTQSGPTPDTHFGHKNVVLPSLEDAELPARPISSRPPAGPPLFARALIGLTSTHPRYQDFARYWSDLLAVRVCPDGGDVTARDSDCMEVARTPDVLFDKLRQWGLDLVVIPHGSAWGNYTPQGTRWDKQIEARYHDPERQTLVEIYSGHGSSEPYREWRSALRDTDGSLRCPEPSEDYLPLCWQAGEIIRSRCLAENESEADCEARAVEARSITVNSGNTPHQSVPGSTPDEWLDAGQCRDCEQPAFSLRPLNTAQYMLARGNFDGVEPRHVQFGFIASSDNHSARGGSGYKEVKRRGMTDSYARPGNRPSISPFPAAPDPPVARARVWTQPPSIATAEIERFNSYLYTGGLIAVHASGRNRESIWEAVKRREVYGTSGPRILLWFDLIGEEDKPAASMGSVVPWHEGPRFQARAVGSFEQLPGCPDETVLPEEEIARLCMGECYNPSDRRRLISRIDVVRIRPQQDPSEPIGTLIEDPWRSLECDPDPAGCVFEFEDPDYATLGRDTVYYVRAVEQELPGINGNGIPVVDGVPIRCPAGPDDDCLGLIEPTAWSSPIFLEFEPPSALTQLLGDDGIDQAR